MLCGACNDILSGKSLKLSEHFNNDLNSSNRSYRSGSTRIHHRNWQSFVKAVSDSCHLCNLIYLRLTPSQIAAHEGSDAAIVYVCNRVFKSLYITFGGMQSALTDGHCISDRVAWDIVFDMVPVTEPNHSAIYDSSDVTGTTVTDESISQACRWYHNCLESHSTKAAENPSRYDNLCDNSPSDFVPTRIIDIGTIGDPRVRLQLSSDGQKPECYVTLSHCWGKDKFLTLNTTNIDTLRKAIDQSTLPKTFRDAIIVARKMDFRYIWIDSLCILQDSEDDWRKESAVMGRIYRNGTLNIAATAASGAADGLDFPRDPFLSKGLRVTVDTAIPLDPDEKAISLGNYYLIDVDSLWSSQVDIAPLNTRGWVLQERLLSPRTLHFARSQLFWQCQTSRTQMIFPGVLEERLRMGGMTQRFFAFQLQGLLPYLQLMKDATTRDDKSVIWHTRVRPVWDRLVTTYTSQKLTRERDKLIAMQAIAQVIEDSLHLCYVAGLWNGLLDQDLLWSASSEGQAVKIYRAQAWRAPTWSWASLDGGPLRRVQPPYSHVPKRINTLVRRIVSEVEGFDGMTTGELKTARLRIKGPLLRVPRACHGEALGDPTLWYQARGYLMQTFDSSYRFFASPDHWDWSARGATDYTMSPDTWLFPISAHHAILPPDPNKDNIRMEGLILARSRRLFSRELIFRRTGYFALDNFVSGIKDSFLAESRWSYKGTDADGCCDFTLI